MNRSTYKYYITPNANYGYSSYLYRIRDGSRILKWYRPVPKKWIIFAQDAAQFSEWHYWKEISLAEAKTQFPNINI